MRRERKQAARRQEQLQLLRQEVAVRLLQSQQSKEQFCQSTNNEEEVEYIHFITKFSIKLLFSLSEEIDIEGCS